MLLLIFHVTGKPMAVHQDYNNVNIIFNSVNCLYKFEVSKFQQNVTVY